MHERRRILVKGIVQGVGFRPFVYSLAQQLGLVGYTFNDTTGVTIEVEGEAASVETFWQTVQNKPPPLAMIESLAWETIPLNGDTVFAITPSQGQAEKQVFISPDVCICDDCLRELFDPADWRYRYPFINCTNCGPRFTIIHDVPYDRHQTTMGSFSMCPDCQREYDDPSNRRFHAQPNACPQCGPQVYLHEKVSGHSTPLMGDAAIRETQRLLAEGAIVAVKGLGGYHLACDAMNDKAVAKLRSRKHREDKPFALMGANLAAIEELCLVNEDERALLISRQRPIVLLRRREPSPIAAAVAPQQRHLGFMLPYTPLHYLLFATENPHPNPPPPRRRESSVLVMTSGNLRDEPIAYHDDDALSRLEPIADAFLIHNRDIHIRCDDSVVRCLKPSNPPTFQPSNVPIFQHSTLFIRRSRGYAPQPIAVPFEFLQPVLAVGAHLKNTFCLGKERHAFLSHHIGDLENLETLTSFVEAIEHFQRLFDTPGGPTVIAHDLHPEYLSTQWAQQQQGSRGASLFRDAEGREQGRNLPPCIISVQHHHAHIASVIAEHGLAGAVIGVAFDGTGCGIDGTVWGGEFLVADLVDFTRAAHLAYMPLPGGEAAIRQPWRLAAAYLRQVLGEDFLDLDLPFVTRLDRTRWQVLRQMIERGLNSPLTSSMGRLFDAVAALIGLRTEVNYEGQAAIELEMLADDTCTAAYEFEVGVVRPYIIEAGPVITALVEDIRRFVPAAIISAKFHNAVTRLVVDVCLRLREEANLNQVALSGGVFQNMLLLQRTLHQLQGNSFEVYVNTKVPPNDGGISFGQAAVAAARLALTENV